MKKLNKDMGCIRAYKFRLYPDEKRQDAINNTLILSQQLYNKLLEKTIEAHKKKPQSKISQRTINIFMQEILKDDERYYDLYSHVRVDIRNRMLRTYQNFFRRCKQKKSGGKVKVGFPRFKSRDKYNSVMHIENNGSFSIEKGRLRVSKIGTMKIELHRQIEGKIKTMTIKREDGKYYAIFTAIKDIRIPEVKDTNPVGIDMGLKTFAVLSDGSKITKPNFRKNAEKHIARWQRIVARRKKGSRRRQIAKDKLTREYEIANNQANDYLHKITDQLINSGYTSFAVEKLQIQNMMKNHHLAKSINYASWNRFFQYLSYKAESAGMKVIEVDPRETSKTCSNCGNLQNMPLSKRIYFCEGCGLTEDRDINASINILAKAREGHSRSHVQGDSVRPQREAVVEELKTYSASKFS
jgi:putative transposase